MPDVTIRIPMPLRTFANDLDEVVVKGATVGEALKALGAVHSGITERVMTPEGQLRSFVNVYLGTDDINSVDGLDTAVSDGDVLSVVPAVAGGAGVRAKDRKLMELRATIPQVTPREALKLKQNGAVLIDVREPDEITEGRPAGAHSLGRSYLELRIEEVAPDLGQTVVVMCNGGTRSLFAAEDLKRLGYTDVRSITGGFNRWKNDGLPFEVPQILDSDARERYSRHLLMPEVGEAGQLRLLNSKVLLVGVGGLGSPAAFYLAAAGVGTLGIIDHDLVELSNLQRQILHTDDRVGTPKVTSARATLQALNPHVKINEHDVRLDSTNVEAVFRGYDVVVDGSDNFATRYLVNDASVRLGIPNVHGAVFRFEGQVSVFWPAYPKHRGPCYRCVYPEPPPPELGPSCAEAGVLGVLPGVIGVLQAVETIKLLLEVGEPLIGKLLYYDALQARFSELKLIRNPSCAYCGDHAEFPGYVDYEAFCTASTA